MELLQTLVMYKNTSIITLPVSPRQLSRICAIGWPRSESTMELTSEFIVKAMTITTAQPVAAAANSEEIMANGTAFAACDASSAIVAADSLTIC